MPLKVRLLVGSVLLLLLAACIEITGESRSYICVVAGDTLGVRGDSTGIRCADPDSLPEW